MTKIKNPIVDLDIYVLEGKSDIHERIARCLVSATIDVIRADSIDTLLDAPLHRTSIAIISITIIERMDANLAEWKNSHAMPIIWVAEGARSSNARVYPPEYAHILTLDFTCSELRRLVVGLTSELLSLPGNVHGNDLLIAESDIMQRLLSDAKTFSDCESNVLIYGETGVGKERIARFIHDEHSIYGKGPFVAVNCGAIPDGLFESLFFGHAKGAFTGAILAHQGYFEQANGGTLFLDEIGDLPLYQQVKLLRVLEQSVVTRLGSTNEIKVSFRLIVATNRDLRELVRKDMFRSDLYYRIAVIELYVPSLEDRGELDKIAIFKGIVNQLLRRASHQEQHLEIPDWLLQLVRETRFNGNVRELRNIAERVTIIHRQFGDWQREAIDRVFFLLREFNHHSRDDADSGLKNRLDTNERDRIIKVLDAHQWRRLESAAYLKISRKVLWEKMRKYQITSAEKDHKDMEQ